MQLDEARAKSRELLKLGLSDYKAERTLEIDGCDRRTLEIVMSEYAEMRRVATKRRRRLWRLTGALLFFGSGGLFLYGVFFESEHVHTFRFPFLAAAIYGLFRMLLP